MLKQFITKGSLTVICHVNSVVGTGWQEGSFGQVGKGWQD